MQKILWLLRWILKAAIFFTFFAFALNNQHQVAAHFFFGNEWRAPLVVVVLLAFTAGLVLGVLGTLPRWWRRRQDSRRSNVEKLADGEPSRPSPTQAGTGTQSRMM